MNRLPLKPLPFRGGVGVGATRKRRVVTRVPTPGPTPEKEGP